MKAGRRRAYLLLSQSSILIAKFTFADTLIAVIWASMVSLESLIMLVHTMLILNVLVAILAVSLVFYFSNFFLGVWTSYRGSKALHWLLVDSILGSTLR